MSPFRQSAPQRHQPRHQPRHPHQCRGGGAALYFEPWPAAASPSAPAAPAPAGPAAGVFAALMPQLQRAVAEEGYAEPTPIQEQCIGHVLAGRDVLGCAQTGTGKTAAFVLPLLQRLTTHSRPLAPRRPRALILAPTRELAAQIGESIRAYGRHLGVRHTVIFGGVGQGPQVHALQRGVEIAVATPGRLIDLMGQGAVRLDGIETFVLDEADRMLDMGFLPDLRRVLAALPAVRHSLFFSATLPHDVIALARTMVRSPVHITVTPEEPTVAKIAQKVFFVARQDKDALLAWLLAAPGMDKVLVFAQMKHAANRVAEKLDRAGIRVAAIHGNKSQSARTKALAGLKTGHVRALVATDIAARGLDVDGITHVINYDLPLEPGTYVHRIGRTARAGADGDALSFCSPAERDQLRAIERLLRRPIPVETRHPFHSVAARPAAGPAARPAPHPAPHPARRPPQRSFGRRPSAK